MEKKVVEGKDPSATVEGSYCPWCVGREEALRLQRLGYTSKVCPKHARELLEKAKSFHQGDNGRSGVRREHR